MKPSVRSLFPPPLAPVEPRYSARNFRGWAELANDCVRQTRRSLHSGKLESQMDLSGAMLKRRIQAASACADAWIDRYWEDKGAGGGEEERADLGRLWMLLNFAPCVSYNACEAQSHILFAAAIWMLDQITAQPDWREKLYPLLPRDGLALGDMYVYAPDAWDASHEFDLILSVLHVLYYRNTDIAPMEIDANDVERVLNNSLLAGGGQHADVPGRRRYEALIGLLPSEAVERAVKRFEAALYAWTDRYFACVVPLNKAVAEAAQKVNRIVKQYNALRDELAVAVEAAEKRKSAGAPRTNQTKPAFNPLMVKPPEASPFDAGGPAFPYAADALWGPSHAALSQRRLEDPAQRVLDLGHRLSEIEEAHLKALDELDELDGKAAFFTVDILQEGCLHARTCLDEYGPVVAGLMKPLEIENPFEICFALLFLLESGSDLPWLYGPGCGLMQEVVESLPWGIIEYDETDDPVWWPDGQEDGDERPAPLPAEKARQPLESPAAPQWYARKYVPKDEDGAFIFNRNLAQIVYEETGCLLPRDLHKYDGRLQAVMDFGIAEKDAAALLCLFSALSHARRQSHAANLDEDFADWPEAEDAPRPEGKRGAENALTREELSERLKQLREDNRRLLDSLHQSERAFRDAQKELSALRDAGEMERRELASLRELIFNRESPAAQEQPDEAAAAESAFPYAVKGATVIFGGHETWLKAIRPLLTGNVRFVGKELNFDEGIVRRADMIWIQTNALSHKQYYRIIDAARQCRKPVRYFTHASAVKSAEQVMAADSRAGLK